MGAGRPPRRRVAVSIGLGRQGAMQDAAGTATADTSAGRRVRGPRVALLVKLCREREPNRATRSQPRANGGWTEGTGGEYIVVVERARVES